MRIAFIGGFDRLYDEEGKAKSFEKLGCQVLRVNESTFNRDSFDAIKGWKPDVVMSPKFLIGQAERDELFEYCRQHNIKTAAWHPDLYHYGPAVVNENRIALINNRLGPYGAEYVFSPDGCASSDTLYRRLGIKHHTIRQAPYHETVGKFDGSDISDILEGDSIDIVFVGQVYNIPDQFRPVLLEFLNQNYGKRFLWVGKTEHEVREERLSTLISKAKVVIGESFYYPGYWSNRVYEAIGRGGFVIHPYVPGLEKDFEEDKECVFFDRWNFSELHSKLEYYLDPSNEEERKAIASNGMARVSKDHTLLNRCKQIMEILE
jgi:hypothetical protein